MTMRILKNVENGKIYSPCVLCDKVLEEISDGSIERTRQPYAGGEIQFLFSYGSTKFDDNINSTIFAGLICDDCGEKYVKKMTRLTENHHETPPPIPEGYMEALEKMFPVLEEELPSRNNEW